MLFWENDSQKHIPEAFVRKDSMIIVSINCLRKNFSTKKFLDRSIRGGNDCGMK